MRMISSTNRQSFSTFVELQGTQENLAFIKRTDGYALRIFEF